MCPRSTWGPRPSVKESSAQHHHECMPCRRVYSFGCTPSGAFRTNILLDSFLGVIQPGLTIHWKWTYRYDRRPRDHLTRYTALEGVLNRQTCRDRRRSPCQRVKPHTWRCLRLRRKLSRRFNRVGFNVGAYKAVLLMALNI